MRPANAAKLPPLPPASAANGLEAGPPAGGAEGAGLGVVVKGRPSAT